MPAEVFGNIKFEEVLPWGGQQLIMSDDWDVVKYDRCEERAGPTPGATEEWRSLSLLPLSVPPAPAPAPAPLSVVVPLSTTSMPSLSFPPSPYSPPHSPASPRTSMDIFTKFVEWRADGSAEAAGILSKLCFAEWVASRKNKLKNPQLTFVHTVRSHVTGDPKTGRNPFDAAIEASLLKLFRARRIWPCFEGTGVKYGIRGMFVTGFHEGRSLSKASKSGSASASRKSPRRSAAALAKLPSVAGATGASALPPAHAHSPARAMAPEFAPQWRQQEPHTQWLSASPSSAPPPPPAATVTAAAFAAAAAATATSVVPQASWQPTSYAEPLRADELLRLLGMPDPALTAGASTPTGTKRSMPVSFSSFALEEQHSPKTQRVK